MSEPTKCLRCQGDLKTGFIQDVSQNAIFLSSWVEGSPEIRSGWLAAMLGGDWMGKPLDSKSVMGRRRLPIVAYRCTSCGMLEMYAPNPSQNDDSRTR